MRIDTGCKPLGATLLAIGVLGLASAFWAEVASGDLAGATAGGLTLSQRVLQKDELSGFTPQPNPKILTLRAFVKEAAPSYVQITAKSAHQRLAAAGFRAAVISQLASSRRSDLIVASTVIQLGSARQAETTLQWASTDGLRPCPHVCNVSVEPFPVGGIPGAKGVRRSRAENASGAGPKAPFEAYDIEFADGAFLYDVFAVAPRPGSFKRNELIAAVTKLYERVHGRFASSSLGS